jgi:ribonuclease T1
MARRSLSSRARPGPAGSGSIWSTVMRRILSPFLALVLLLALLPALALGDVADLRAFGRSLGLRDLDGFVAVVSAIREDGELPERWITKREAERLGWRPGRDLCDIADDHAIGGDRFGNREGLLPDRKGRRWQEADLDFACGRRGAKRLVFSNDGLIFVTIDHYDSFHEVPE